MESEKKMQPFPGESSESWPEVFTKPPPMPTKLKPGQVSKQELDQFYSEVRAELTYTGIRTDSWEKIN